MELFERRRYYFCRYCGTFHFLDTAETDGIHLLDRPAQARPCPACAAPLAKSLLDNTHVVEFCEQCRGVLLARTSFAHTVTERRAWATGQPEPPAPIDQRELQRRLACPSCGTKMEVHPYYGPGNVVIDTCARCDAVWLDFGELKQIANAPGRDRGSRNVPRSSPPLSTPADRLTAREFWDELLG